MDLFRRKELMDVEEIHALAGLRPLYDPILGHLLEGAYHGSVDIYYAAIPLSVIRPFDPDYDPSKHPVGAAAIADVTARWRAGHFENVVVYQKGDVFILSDDYIIWEAAKRGQPDFLPCWVLGRPQHFLAVDVQGPLARGEVAKVIGLPAPPHPKDQLHP